MSAFPLRQPNQPAKLVRPQPRFNKFDKVKLNALCAQDGTVVFWVDMITGMLHLGPGVTFDLDNTLGNSIGSMVTDLLSFFGKLPTVPQQTGGNLVAGATYTANEQNMIQTMWNALRAYGLLS